MPVTSYSTTAASNNSAPPNGAPEAMAPSAVNDTIRQIMADIAVEAQTNNVKVLKTIAGTNTITADMDPELAAYVAGMIVVFLPAGANTGATTINIDGLGAKSIVKGNAAALVANDLLTTVEALLVYNGTAFDLMNPASVPLTAAGILAALLTVDGAGSGLDADLIDGINGAALAQASTGSYTGTLTGCTTSPTATINYTIVSNFVCVSLPALTATSNSTALTITGAPAGIRPTVPNPGRAPVQIIDNGITVEFALANMDDSGLITFSRTGGFTAAGVKGCLGGTLSYLLL